MEDPSKREFVAFKDRLEVFGEGIDIQTTPEVN